MKKIIIARFLKYFLVAIAMVPGLYARAQRIDELKAGLTSYHQNHVAEKIFVHLNKDFFSTGEIAWFKLYCVNGATNYPMDMSKVAYIELLDSKNTPVLQIKAELKQAIGSGSIYLPSTLESGSYKLRAYTNWMKNFGPESFYEQKITIVNLMQLPASAKKTADDYDVQFMPEGGSLVQGLPARVAVKVTADNGMGAIYTGIVVNEKKDTVARFSPLKFGIGSFSFTPLSGHTYTAVLKVNGKTLAKPLPNVAQSGYVIRAEDAGSSWNISVSATTGMDTDLYMLVHSAAGVVSASALKAPAGYTLNKAQLPNGVSIITLFNSKRQPVCERLIFKRPANNLQISAKPDAAAYEQRQKVTITINIGMQGMPSAPTNLSLSVFKTDSLQKATSPGIDSYLWLSSELKGSVQSPEYYLTPSADADRALDNLLLAQGWRNFSRATVSASSNYKFVFLPEYAGNIVTAKITHKATGMPAKNITAYLSIPDTIEKLYTAVSDSTGKLNFSIGRPYGNREIVLQTNHFNDTTLYRFELTDAFLNQYSAPVVQSYIAPPASRLDEYGLSMQVQNAYNANNTRRFYSPPIDTLPFYGTPNRSFLLDDFTRFTTMEEVLQEYVTFIENVRRGGKMYVSMYNQSGVLKDNPLITIDGVPLFDNNRVYKIDPLKIKRIHVVNKRYLQGSARYEGMLTIASKNGDMGGFELDPRTVVLDYKGLQEQRQFYSPVYETEANRALRIPDYRNALCWNPDITTNESGVITISCYTSDLAGAYFGVVQGLTHNGLAGSASFTFDVK